MQTYYIKLQMAAHVSFMLNKNLIPMLSMYKAVEGHVSWALPMVDLPKANMIVIQTLVF